MSRPFLFNCITVDDIKSLNKLSLQRDNEMTTPLWQQIDDSESSQTSSHSQIELLSSQNVPDVETAESIQYHHLKERLEPSTLLFFVAMMSENITCGYILLMGYFYLLLIVRFVYLRWVRYKH
jgi:hypothetical protein